MKVAHSLVLPLKIAIFSLLFPYLLVHAAPKNQILTEEFKLLSLVNTLRAEVGAPALIMNEALTAAARLQSDYMNIANGLTTHFGPPPENSTPFQRMEQFEMGNYKTAGENVACGYPDAIRTFRQWAFSPGHYKNMVNPNFDLTGVARSGNGEQFCKYYWTQDFYSNENTPDRNPVIILTPDALATVVERIAPKPKN